MPELDLERSHTRLPLPPRVCYDHNVHYGARFVAAEYCGLTSIPIGGIAGEWVHGWHPPEHNVHPELVIGSNGQSMVSKRHRQHWLAREDQAAYLSLHGYRKATAVGMPILYLPKIDTLREHGSLLVLPVHSLPTTTHSWDFNRYVDEILAIRERFSKIVACIHSSCIDKGYWSTSFASRGIPVISGADPNDKNSLLRMAVLFSGFEFVTTNGIGSHVAYSSFFGAKTTIYGSTPEVRDNDYKNVAIYKNCPELLPIVLRMTTSTYLRRTYPQFFVPPWLGKTNVDWAGFQLGLKHKRTPEDMKRLFFSWPSRAQHIVSSARRRLTSTLSRLATHSR